MSGSKKFGYILFVVAVVLLGFGFAQWATLMNNHIQLLIKGDSNSGFIDIWRQTTDGMIPLLLIMGALGGLVCAVAIPFICGECQIVDKKKNEPKVYPDATHS